GQLPSGHTVALGSLTDVSEDACRLRPLAVSNHRGQATVDLLEERLRVVERGRPPDAEASTQLGEELADVADGVAVERELDLLVEVLQPVGQVVRYALGVSPVVDVRLQALGGLVRTGRQALPHRLQRATDNSHRAKREASGTGN